MAWRDTTPNQALEPTPTAFAPALLRLLAWPRRSVAMTSNVKSGEQLFQVIMMFFALSVSEEAEPVSYDG